VILIMLLLPQPMSLKLRRTIRSLTDGNKRTAWVPARLFLAANGKDLEFAKADAVTLMKGGQLASWTR
tara:strand:- start:206 stop:409 length:204 start_codon:yes stop_codon:yes gene_type:complete